MNIQFRFVCFTFECCWWFLVKNVSYKIESYACKWNLWWWQWLGIFPPFANKRLSPFDWMWCLTSSRSDMAKRSVEWKSKYWSNFEMLIYFNGMIAIQYKDQQYFLIEGNIETHWNTSSLTKIKITNTMGRINAINNRIENRNSRSER